MTIRQAPDDLVELGRIASAFGVQGWVKVIPHASQSESLKKAKVWWLKAPASVNQAGAFSSPLAYRVMAARQHGATVLAQLESVTDRDQAHGLKANTVWVARSDFAPLAEGEYYWVDLIGCHFYGQQDGHDAFLGVVSEVFDNGAHAVIVLHRGALNEAQQFKPLLDAKGQAIEELIPFVQAVVHTVDLQARRLLSNWSI